MHLYEEAHGFTRLRLLADVFEGWLGLLVLAVLARGKALKAPWLPRLALLGGAGLLLGIAAINPDAWIAERNITRFEARPFLTDIDPAIDADFQGSMRCVA
jgi:two-component system sensor histidine kinase BaeS